MTYLELDERLGNRDRRKLENNTYLERQGGEISVLLHDTKILTFTSDGVVRYNSGGWRTQTTKDRLNKYGPRSIHQRSGEWYVEGKVFADGMTVTPEGRVIGAGKETPKSLLKAARQYVKDYIEELYAGKIPAPSVDDCWGCLMRTKEGKRPMGGPNHIKSHIKEKYYVPSLLVAAFERFGASVAMKHDAAVAWERAIGNSEHEFIPGGCKEQTERFLWRYVKSELSLSA